MSRNPRYQEFLNANRKGSVDPLPKTQVTEATVQEMGWQQQLEVRRAIHAMRYDIATPQQLALLEDKHITIPAGAVIRTRKLSQWYDRPGYISLPPPPLSVPQSPETFV